MARRLMLWSQSTAWMELLCGLIAMLWGGGHLMQGQALGHTFGAIQRLFTAEQIEWAFLIVGTLQVLTVEYGGRRWRGIIAFPAFILNIEVVFSVLFQGIVPWAATASFFGAAAACGVTIVRNLFSSDA